MLFYRYLGLLVVSAFAACSPSTEQLWKSHPGEPLTSNSIGSESQQPKPWPRLIAQVPGSKVTLSGTAQDKAGDRFTLDPYRVTVELSGWTKNDPNSLLAGDEVTVQGTIAQNQRGQRFIDARSVFVRRLDTTLHRTLPPIGPAASPRY